MVSKTIRSQLWAVKDAVKAVLPQRLLWPYYWLKYRRPLEDIFTEIYSYGGWRGKESVSGQGSDLSHTVVVRQELPLILKELNIKTILDAPCGDFNWMKTILPDHCSYTGIDIVEELIRKNTELYGGSERSFRKLDLCSDSLPKVDLIISRDCLAHLSNKAAKLAIENFRASGSRYLLTTTYPNTARNEDTFSGWWRPLNLQLAPIGMPEPIRLIRENPEVPKEDPHFDKHMALWKLAD
jgi:SAM-dependent methyltransferase